LQGRTLRKVDEIDAAQFSAQIVTKAKKRRRNWRRRCCIGQVRVVPNGVIGDDRSGVLQLSGDNGSADYRRAVITRSL